jgi:NitT/TauT family transport system substrate-binding protein
MAVTELGALEPVRFVEPFRSLLYCPHYLAIGLGLFTREGLSVEQSTAGAASGVARLLLDGEADIGVSGPIRALAAADRGEGPLTCLAEVVSRAGFFLLGRPPAREVAWRDLAGRRVAVFREAPTPRLCLEYVLERHGVSPGAVDLVADLATELAVERFLEGRFDYLLETQPVVEELLAGGRAFLAAALGPALGPVAFSAYLASPRVLAARGHVVDGALRALCRAQRWLHTHGPEAIGAEVAWAFPGLAPRLLVAAIRRYLATRTWAPDPVLRRPAFDALQEVLLLRGFIRRTHPYEALVDPDRALAALAAVRAVDEPAGAGPVSGPSG